MHLTCGEMSEWPMVPASKTGERVMRSEGSNPSFSAKSKNSLEGEFFYVKL